MAKSTGELRDTYDAVYVDRSGQHILIILSWGMVIYFFGLVLELLHLEYQMVQGLCGRYLCAVSRMWFFRYRLI